MKTAEEILRRHVADSQWYAPVCDARILAAMNEYALQFIHPKDCYQCDGTGAVIFPSKATQQCMICNGTGKLIIMPIQQNT